jgi:hypothetical protein
MKSGDESLQRALELDQLIEARGAGDLASDDTPEWALVLVELASDLGALGREVELPGESAVWSRIAGELAARAETEAEPLSVAAGLEMLGREGELPDEEAVWSRVSVGIAADRAREHGRHGLPWWKVGPFGRRPLLWGPVGAVAAVLVAVVLLLAQPPVNTAEAFVRDVEALSTLADVALADGVLTEDEKNSVADLVIELRLMIDRRPETLIELDAETRRSVLATLSAVTERLIPLADEELVQLRSAPPPGLSIAIDAVEGSSDAREPGIAAATAVSEATEEPTPEPGEDAPGRGAEVRSSSAPSAPPGLSGVAPVVASSVTSLHEVVEAVQGAGGGDSSPSVSPVTPGQLLGLCRELRGQERSGCQRAINAAIAACTGAADRDSLGDCADAATFARDVCVALLPSGEALVCSEALAGLESGEQIGGSRGQGDTNRGSIDEAESDGDSTRGRGDNGRPGR